MWGKLGQMGSDSGAIVTRTIHSDTLSPWFNQSAHYTINDQPNGKDEGSLKVISGLSNLYGTIPRALK